MKNVIAIALLFFAFEKIHAQLKENTPCTAICVDYTKSSITGRQPNQNGISPNLNLPCGSGSTEDNPFWWMLRPSGTQLTFQFTTSNCMAGNSFLGVQLTLWEGDNCGSLTAVDCVKGEAGTLSTAVNPYKLYYLQIDGNGECQCNFIISYDKNQLLSALAPPTISGPRQICKASNIRYNASIPALPGLAPDSWNWTLEPANAGVLTKVPGSPAEINLNFTTVPPNGKLKICAQPVYKSKCSPSTQKSCYELDVIDLQPATCKVEICPQSLPFNLSLAACVLTTNPNFGRRMTPAFYTINYPAGTRKLETITYTVNDVGCKQNVTLDIHIKEDIPIELPPLLLCEDEKVSVKGNQFSCEDAGNTPITIYSPGKQADCDTTFEMYVKCLQVKPIIQGIASLDCSRKQVSLNTDQSITLPANTNNGPIGIGSRSYKWSKDGVVLPAEIGPTLLVTQAGEYELSLAYTYLWSQDINGVLNTFSKTCEKSTKVRIVAENDTPVAETPIARKKTCANENAIYYINPDPLASSYQWSVSGSATIIGSNNDPQHLEVKNNGGDYQVCLLKNACNKTSAQQCISVKPVAALSKPQLNVTNICQGDSTSYQLENFRDYASDVHFIWTVVEGRITYYNRDSTLIYVKWNNSNGTKKIQVQAKSDCGAETSEFQQSTFSQGIISSNSPLCTYNTLQLNASGGDKYRWAGPNGFSSTMANPQIATITQLNAGTYFLTVSTSQGCQFMLQTEVIVSNNEIIQAFASSNSPVCILDSLKLRTNPGSSFSWTGPANYVSNEQNPNLLINAKNQEGVYSVTISAQNGCTATANTEVLLNSGPSLEAICSTPVCVGGSAYFFAIGSSNVQWTGPNNFKSSEENPVIDNVDLKHSGIYSVTAKGSNSCRTIATTQLTVQKCVATKDSDKWQDLKIFPNPANERLFISAGSEIKKIQIFNTLGQQIFETNDITSTPQIDLTNFGEGTYFLKVYFNENEAKTYTFSIVR